MNNFVSFEKLSKKEQKEQKKLNNLKRKSWNTVNPITKVVSDKTKYSRKEKHKKGVDSYYC